MICVTKVPGQLGMKIVDTISGTAINRSSYALLSLLLLADESLELVVDLSFFIIVDLFLPPPPPPLGPTPCCSNALARLFKLTLLRPSCICNRLNFIAVRYAA
ncbi:hypothetical protein DERF_004504 [Dermatophagoides farinae]|uniref:Uncharacterized protein n=1 Tax=Dermatophagoides farinae TaxID=6954 RepID=A0A922I2I2_DERFA|nr:hypothetical protein DERF_004504 [Dermatophagoides farinae]